MALEFKFKALPLVRPRPTAQAPVGLEQGGPWRCRRGGSALPLQGCTGAGEGYVQPFCPWAETGHTGTGLQVGCAQCGRQAQRAQVAVAPHAPALAFAGNGYAIEILHLGNEFRREYRVQRVRQRPAVHLVQSLQACLLAG